MYGPMFSYFDTCIGIGPIVCKLPNMMRKSLIATMLSPDTKGLNFLPDLEKLSAHQLLLTKALSLVDPNENLLANIKKNQGKLSHQIQFNNYSSILR